LGRSAATATGCHEAAHRSQHRGAGSGNELDPDIQLSAGDEEIAEIRAASSDTRDSEEAARRDIERTGIDRIAEKGTPEIIEEREVVGDDGVRGEIRIDAVERIGEDVRPPEFEIDPIDNIAADLRAGGKDDREIAHGIEPDPLDRDIESVGRKRFNSVRKEKSLLESMVEAERSRKGEERGVGIGHKGMRIGAAIEEEAAAAGAEDGHARAERITIDVARAAEQIVDRVSLRRNRERAVAHGVRGDALDQIGRASCRERV